MDYLRRCYVTRVRPFAGSNETATIRWFWSPEGAPVLRGAIWRSSTWYVQDVDGQYPPPPPIGEERSEPFRWSPGRLGQDLAVAKCTVGDPAWFSTGIPPSANVPNPPPLPACCVITPRIGVGGFRLGGIARRVRLAQGGLVLGGVAGRLAAVAGGLLLGGVAETPPAPVSAGGLLLGGTATAYVPVSAGGLLLGGVAETPPAPVSAGGLLLGGVVGEPMALLYCSIRNATTQSIPDNVATALTWDTVESDPSGMFSAGHPTRITAPVSGVYVVEHTLNWSTLASGIHVEGLLKKNGSSLQTLYGGATGVTSVDYRTGSALALLSPGDYLESFAYQHSGSAASPSTAGFLRASFRVAGLAIPGLLFARVKRAAALSCAASTETPIPWDTVQSDPHGFWSAGQPTRLTAPVSGLYLLQTGNLWNALPPNTLFHSSFNVNGSFYIFSYQWLVPGPTATVIGGSGSTTIAMNAGDYIEVKIWQNGAAAHSTWVDGSTDPWVQMTWLGPVG